MSELAQTWEDWEDHDLLNPAGYEVGPAWDNPGKVHVRVAEGYDIESVEVSPAHAREIAAALLQAAWEVEHGPTRIGIHPPRQPSIIGDAVEAAIVAEMRPYNIMRPLMEAK